MEAALEREVRNRAGGFCEYCRFPEAYHRKTFHIDHITAEQHEGLTESKNLALCCSHCNLNKGPNIAGIDPITKRVTRLYSPRKDRWRKHFAWNGAIVVGLTSIGRTTIAVLKMNSGIRVQLRASLISAGLFPRKN